MSVFIDASVLVAVLASEPDADGWALRIESEPACFTSPIAIWETVRALGRATETQPSEIHRQLCDILGAMKITIVDIGPAEARGAVRAHEQFGKGRHVAKLNMGDCFAYACAKTNDAGLLYKGDDFAQTDLA